jgi:hypothetical protein
MVRHIHNISTVRYLLLIDTFVYVRNEHQSQGKLEIDEELLWK